MQLWLDSARSRTLSFEARVKTLCSVFGCLLRVITAAQCDSAVDCVHLLLLDILSALHETARHHCTTDTPWHGVVDQLTEAVSELEGHDLSAVVKKLVQMREIV